nr:MlaD family protein [Williamsia sp. D3]
MSRGTGRVRRIWSMFANDVVLGIGVVVVAVIVLTAFGLVYMRPPDQKTITFETTDASAITVGQDVRIAGISVGKVSDISIEPNTVRVAARVKDSTFVGDQTRVEVRMLTPVGGYAISLVPRGAEQASDALISTDRVSVPYSIGDVLQSAPTVTDEVDATQVQANLDQVADALNSNSTSLRSIVDGLDSITGVFERQRWQVDQIASLASEYLRTFEANRQFVFELITKIDTVVNTYLNNAAGFNYAYLLLGNVLSKLAPFGEFYLQNSDLVRTHVENLKTMVADIQQNLGPAIDNLQSLRGQMEQWLGPEGMKQFGGGKLWTSQLCVPIPGREC